MVFLSLVVGYAAWIWRLALAERLADRTDELELGAGAGSARGAGGGAAGD
jgi:hypothetical protein